MHFGGATSISWIEHPIFAQRAADSRWPSGIAIRAEGSTGRWPPGLSTNYACGAVSEGTTIGISVEDNSRLFWIHCSAYFRLDSSNICLPLIAFQSPPPLTQNRGLYRRFVELGILVSVMGDSSGGKEIGCDLGGEVLRKLHACSMSEKETGGVELRTNDVKAGDEECERSLFGKIVGDRPANIMGVKRMMSNIWKLQQAMEVKEISSNYFQFLFTSMDDKAKVVAGNNWLFENQYLILTEWFEGLHNTHPCFDEINIWVQVQNVPLNWMCTEVGMRIGQIFNKVKNMVICKVGGEVGSFIKILVGLNLKEPIPRCTVVKLGDTRTMVIFRYERLVNLCYYYGMIGHLDRGCNRRAEDIEKGKPIEGQFGEWLKAKETYHGGRTFQASSSEDRSVPPQQNSNQVSIVSASVTPASKAYSTPDVHKGSLVGEKGDAKIADSLSNNPRGLEIIPSSVDSMLFLNVDLGERKEYHMDMEPQGLRISLSLELLKGKAKGAEITKPVSTWRRKDKSAGRLLRLSDNLTETSPISGRGKEGEEAAPD
ncbi:Unknown protein [Striga hermonthica]|uniref:DUF4283 domain-containing protein n=1 Tax=Striga hermonthica TaxID=68872 RepID=A0A9N7NV92_STRHE|nr:Unknown protein [Striga hermonthica]